MSYLFGCRESHGRSLPRFFGSDSESKKRRKKKQQQKEKGREERGPERRAVVRLAFPDFVNHRLFLSLSPPSPIRP